MRVICVCLWLIPYCPSGGLRCLVTLKRSLSTMSAPRSTSLHSTTEMVAARIIIIRVVIIASSTAQLKQATTTDHRFCGGRPEMLLLRLLLLVATAKVGHVLVPGSRRVGASNTGNEWS